MERYYRREAWRARINDTRARPGLASAFSVSLPDLLCAGRGVVVDEMHPRSGERANKQREWRAARIQKDGRSRFLFVTHGNP